MKSGCSMIWWLVICLRHSLDQVCAVKEEEETGHCVEDLSGVSLSYIQ